MWGMLLAQKLKKKWSDIKGKSKGALKVIVPQTGSSAFLMGMNNSRIPPFWHWGLRCKTHI